jgi:hypothetical protein
VITFSLYHDIPVAATHVVRLVDGCGNSRVAAVCANAVAIEWTCPHTGRITGFRRTGQVTDGARRPVWHADGALERGVKMRPVPSRRPLEFPPFSDDLWNELYRRVPPMPSAILNALLRGANEPQESDDDTTHGY